MYGTAVNQLVTVAVFPDAGMVLQSIQLAGYRNIRFLVVRSLFVCMIQEPGTATPFSFRANNRAFLRPSDAF